jgi:hypothetical protein
MGPSRAETSDNWGADRKFTPAGPDDRGRGGFGGGFRDRDREGGFREREGGFRDRSRCGGAGCRQCAVQQQDRQACGQALRCCLLHSHGRLQGWMVPAFATAAPSPHSQQGRIP